MNANERRHDIDWLRVIRRSNALRFLFGMKLTPGWGRDERDLAQDLA
jgi:hypothetical protein